MNLVNNDTTKFAKELKRIAIFLCYDKDGIIDDYIPYLLKDLKENLAELVVTVNGTLSSEGRQKLESITEHIYVRENKGADAGAWKDAMIYYVGWDKLTQYDELILLNDSFYGPFYPFHEVFTEMDGKPVDFWGLLAHGEDSMRYEDCPYPHLPEHIQSYFIAIRKRMFLSREFRKYWENMPYFATVQNAISKHETVFTKYFSDLGYQWDTFINVSDLDGQFPKSKATVHCFLNTYELIHNRKCPFLKRHCFGFPYQSHLLSSNGMHLRQSMAHIAAETDYDLMMIYKNIIRIYDVADIFYNLQLTYILPKRYQMQAVKKSYSAVVVIHIEDINSLEIIESYLLKMPEYIDFIITLGGDMKLTDVKNKMVFSLDKRFKVLVSPEAGKEMSAFLITAMPYLFKYDYIGFCHDIRFIKGEEVVTVLKSLQDLMVENVIGSVAFVENVLALLEQQPEVGLLCVPPPRHAQHSCDFLSPWKSDYEVTKRLAERLHLHAKLAEDSIPLMNETAFWCRRDAILPLLNYSWKVEDFQTAYVMAETGSLYQALKRIFPFVAQHQGYLTGWVMTDDYARTEINNINYILKSQANISKSQALFDSLSFNQFLTLYLKRKLPRPLLESAKKIKRLLKR